MSIPLPTIDLTGSVVGTQGKINLNQVGISAGGPSAHPSLTEQKAHLLIYNESGFGLLLSFPSGGTGVYAPAGAWFPLEIPPGQNELDYVVLYILTSAQVSLLLVTYFAPGEPIKVAQIGNSPIAGGSVTSNVSTLSNEGNSPGTVKVIDIGDTNFADLIDIFNNGALSIAVDQSNVKHFVIVTSASGTPLSLGQAGDSMNVLSQMEARTTAVNSAAFVTSIDWTDGTQIGIFGGTTHLDIQLLTNGNFIVKAGGTQIVVVNTTGLNVQNSDIIIDNNKHIQCKDSGGTARNVLSVDTLNSTIINGVTGKDEIHFILSSATDIAKINGSGINLLSGNFVYLNGGVVARHGGARGVAAGSGTVISHGLGATPTSVQVTPEGAQPFSATVGVDTYTSTQFTCTIGAGSAMTWEAFF